MEILKNHTCNTPFFEEFFDSGLDESISPFITPSSRSYSKNLSIRASFLALLLLIFSFALSFFPHWRPLANVLLIFVYFLSGIPSLIKSCENILNLNINISVLMTLAAFLSALIGNALEGGLLLVLFSLSGAIEHNVDLMAKGALHRLHHLSPMKALLISPEGHTFEKSIKDIQEGEEIFVRAQEMIPLDGEIMEGTSSVSLDHLTGESLPIMKSVGDKVMAGSKNLEGVLTVKVSQIFRHSTLTKLIALVTQAQESSPPLQKHFDKWSDLYAKTVIALSIFFSLFLPFFSNIPFLGQEGSVYRSVAFLIAASPCALILALPVTYLSAIGSCCKKGILLKGGYSLDAFSKCRALAFDKTGTLTTGKLIVTQIESTRPNSIERNTILSIAASLEKNVSHPISEAILKIAHEEKAPFLQFESIQIIPGKGVEAKIRKSNEMIAIGHPQFIQENFPGPSSELIEEKLSSVDLQSKSVAALYYKKEVFLFYLEDKIRSDLSSVISSLREEHGLDIFMLTGDHKKNALKVAKEIQLDPEHVFADLSPQDKLRIVEEKSSSKGLAMIGDGINDAPALAKASCGIAMGKIGSTSAVDAAKIVLLQDNLSTLSWLWKKAKSTRKIIIQNLCLALFAIIVTSLSALTGFVPLWLAVICHEGSTVLVGLNGLRALK